MLSFIRCASVVMRTCGVLPRSNRSHSSGPEVLHELSRQWSSWRCSCVAYCCHLVHQDGSGATTACTWARRRRVLKIWPANVSRWFRRTRPSFVWHLPTRQRLRLCIFYLQLCCWFRSRVLGLLSLNGGRLVSRWGCAPLVSIRLCRRVYTFLCWSSVSGSQDRCKLGAWCK